MSETLEVSESTGDDHPWIMTCAYFFPLAGIEAAFAIEREISECSVANGHGTPAVKRNEDLGILPRWPRTRDESRERPPG